MKKNSSKQYKLKKTIDFKIQVKKNFRLDFVLLEISKDTIGIRPGIQGKESQI